MSVLGAWRTWARRLKLEVYALALAARDPRTPLPAKILAGAVAAYALSPIDLIPDFLPVIGYLDDLLLVPLGIFLALKMVPSEVLRDCRSAALSADRQRLLGRRGAVVIVLVWILALALIALVLFQRFRG